MEYSFEQITEMTMEEMGKLPKEVLNKYTKELNQKSLERVKQFEQMGATIEQLQGEVRELKSKGGRPGGVSPTNKSTWHEISNAIKEHKSKIIAVQNKAAFEPIQLKTVANISSANNSANYLNYIDWRPGMEPTGQTRFRDFVRTLQSTEDFVSYPRANNPIGEGSFNRQATEGAQKSQVDRDYTMVTLTLKPMSGYAVVSRQSLRNIVFLQQWLPTSLLEQLEDEEDRDFANALVAAATGSSTTSGITVTVERLIHLIKNQGKLKYSTTAIAIDPDVWAEVLTTKPQDYSVPNCVTIDTNGTVRILGRPLWPVNWLTGRRVLVGDFAKASIVQSEGLLLRQSDSHASIFTSNETCFLIERTEGLAIHRVDAFITTTL